MQLENMQSNDEMYCTSPRRRFSDLRARFTNHIDLETINSIRLSHTKEQGVFTGVPKIPSVFKNVRNLLENDKSTQRSHLSPPKRVASFVPILRKSLSKRTKRQLNSISGEIDFDQSHDSGIEIDQSPDFGVEADHSPDSFNHFSDETAPLSSQRNSEALTRNKIELARREMSRATMMAEQAVRRVDRADVAIQWAREEKSQAIKAAQQALKAAGGTVRELMMNAGIEEKESEQEGYEAQKGGYWTLGEREQECRDLLRAQKVSLQAIKDLYVEFESLDGIPPPALHFW